MKRFISVVIVMSILLSVFSNIAVFANTPDVYDNYNNYDYHEHNFDLPIIAKKAHPHNGYLECDCGDRLYFNYSVNIFCPECDEVPYEEHIHLYNYDMYYDDEAQVSYAECFCGSLIEIDYNEEEVDWHYEHYLDNELEPDCEFCQIIIENVAELEEYFIDSTVYDYYDDDLECHTRSDNNHVFKWDEYPSISSSHPHSGYFECYCGERLYFDSSFYDCCDECRELSCEKDIHHYSEDFYYDSDEDTAYCECVCGETLELYCTPDMYDEHISHLEEEVTCTGCDFCNLEREYRDELEWYLRESTFSNDRNQTSNSSSKTFNSYICSLTDGEHIFSYGEAMSVVHPHEGYFSCACGEKLYFTESALPYCLECNEILCSMGIHNYYSNIVYYDNSHLSGYGQCYCGDTMDFEDARSIYKNMGLRNSSDNFIVPCAKCTLNYIYFEQRSLWKEDKMRVLSTIATIYKNNEDLSFAHNHYSDGSDYMYVAPCYHSDTYLEKLHDESTTTTQNITITNSVSTSVNVSVSVPVIAEPTTNTTNTTPTNNNHSNNATSNPYYTETVDEYEEEFDSEAFLAQMYYDYDLPLYDSLPLATIPSKSFQQKLDDFTNQVLFGNYSEVVTLEGTIGEILFSFTGIDLYKDVTDLIYELQHFKHNFNSYTSTFLSALALFPIIGIFKSADEIALLKRLKDVDVGLIKKLKLLSASDVKKLMTISDGHTLTKHIGKTNLVDLKAIRKGTKNVSSFLSEDVAINAVQSALKDKKVAATIINQMKTGSKVRFPVEFDTKKVIGVGLFNKSNDLKNVTKVRIIIQPTSSTDFYIKTAYPIQ